jgi:hypothetical protein
MVLAAPGAMLVCGARLVEQQAGDLGAGDGERRLRAGLA